MDTGAVACDGVSKSMTKHTVSLLATPAPCWGTWADYRRGKPIVLQLRVTSSAFASNWRTRNLLHKSTTPDPRHVHHKNLTKPCLGDFDRDLIRFSLFSGGGPNKTVVGSTPGGERERVGVSGTPTVPTTSVQK
eukprot:173549-Lingulodinium_polyedra.AAC.1